MHFFLDHVDLMKILISMALGAAMGIEREYRSKAAGFRTLTMISVGACLITITSQYLGGPNNPDRIASNIVQGIGFLGAGVIFKDNLSVSGLTTATAIWVASAIGMAVGSGNYLLALITTGAALVVLAGFEYVQARIDTWHQYRIYKLTYEHGGSLSIESLEKDFQRHKIKFMKRKESRDHKEVTVWYELYGNQAYFTRLDNWLVGEDRIICFSN